MFVACGIWCLADVSRVSPSSESAPTATFVDQIHILLKWSTIGLGFDGAETNCRIAHILGTQLMISY